MPAHYRTAQKDPSRLKSDFLSVMNENTLATGKKRGRYPPLQRRHHKTRDSHRRLAQVSRRPRHLRGWHRHSCPCSAEPARSAPRETGFFVRRPAPSETHSSRPPSPCRRLPADSRSVSSPCPTASTASKTNASTPSRSRSPRCRVPPRPLHRRLQRPRERAFRTQRFRACPLHRRRRPRHHGHLRPRQDQPRRLLEQATAPLLPPRAEIHRRRGLGHHRHHDARAEAVPL